MAGLGNIPDLHSRRDVDSDGDINMNSFVSFGSLSKSLAPGPTGSAKTEIISMFKTPVLPSFTDLTAKEDDYAELFGTRTMGVVKKSRGRPRKPKPISPIRLADQVVEMPDIYEEDSGNRPRRTNQSADLKSIYQDIIEVKTDGRTRKSRHRKTKVRSESPKVDLRNSTDSDIDTSLSSTGNSEKEEGVTKTRGTEATRTSAAAYTDDPTLPTGKPGTNLNSNHLSPSKNVQPSSSDEGTMDEEISKEWTPYTRKISAADLEKMEKKKKQKLLRQRQKELKKAERARKRELEKQQKEQERLIKKEQRKKERALEKERLKALNAIQKEEKQLLKKEEKKPKKAKSKKRGSEALSGDESSDSDARPGFVFLQMRETRVLKPRKKVVAERNTKIMKLDPFASPKKQRVGELQLEDVGKSPSKRGVPPTNLFSPSRTPNGRAGSPRKVQKQVEEIQDRSARKKLNKKLYRILEDGVEEDDEFYQDDVRVAEKIIEESKKHEQPPTPSRKHLTTPRRNDHRAQIPTHDPDFVPTPLPTAKDEELFLNKKYDDKALFLDGPDGYFDQHRLKVRNSHNSMVQAPALDYDEFNSLVLLSGFLHSQQKAKLLEGYKGMYTQWLFELEQGFNLLFYGIGSKRAFLVSFVQDYLMDHVDAPAVVVNGYNPLTNFGEILKQVAAMFKLTALPKKNGEIVDALTTHFEKMEDKSPKLILLFHNIDAESLREEKIQDYISRLASIKQIYVVASMDHINAPLLWDSIRLSNLNFVWHNLTTFTDYLTEVSFRDPLVLGQTQKSAGSKGAKYVLSSLTSNSKSLYRVLASNQLQLMEEELATKNDGDRNTLRGTIKHALEFSRFFHLCAEEFISSNEINFRTMLMEFVEHKMAALQKDTTGTEMVFIPFTLEEIQKLLEEELL